VCAAYKTEKSFVVHTALAVAMKGTF